MATKFFYRAPHNYDADSVSLETGLDCPEPTLAVQSEAENCDINVIMRRFGQGIPPPIKHRVPLDVDWDQVSSYQDALDVVVRAREAFAEVPAEIRARFHNDPHEYLDFCMNPDNYDEALKLGLVEARPSASEPAPAGSPVEGEQAAG